MRGSVPRVGDVKPLVSLQSGNQADWRKFPTKGGTIALGCTTKSYEHTRYVSSE